jgi:FemAB-related protein (PEP-CTERM system-associated)
VTNAWNSYLLSQVDATPFHSTAWIRAVERAFGYESRNLYAERDGEICGVLPLFLVSNWIMGRCLISTPFADYGGTCAEDDATALALINRAKEIAAREEVDLLELRHRRSTLFPGFIHKSLYVNFSGPIDSDSKAGFAKLPRDTRYMIRKGEKAGLRFSSGVDGQLSSFYSLFAERWQRFGTPVFSRKWLEILIEEFGDSIDLKLIFHQNRAVAAVFSIYFGDTIFAHYAGAAEDANRLSANNLMYWELMKDAAAHGMRRFDFGRSKVGTGAYQFKCSWNMEPAILDYQIHLARRKTLPDFSPLNPKFQLAAKVWSRLPASAASWLGPKVVRWFP